MEFASLLYEKCAKCFMSAEEADLFIIQCFFDGNRYIGTDIESYTFNHRIVNRYIVYYMDTTPKRRIKQMTVKELIVKNGIESFTLTFTNALGMKIENPNSNILAEMTVKSAEFDWVSQKAKISVVTL